MEFEDRDNYLKDKYLVSVTTLENKKLRTHSKPLNKIPFHFRDEKEMTIDDIIEQCLLLKKAIGQLAKQVDSLRKTLNDEGRLF